MRCSPSRRSSDQPNGNSQDSPGSLTTSISVGKRPAIFPSIGENVIPNFTLPGKPNLAVRFVEVGIIILMGARFPPVDPTIHNGDSATITTEGPNAAKTPVLSATAAKPATETTQPSATMTPLQKLEARLIRNHQTADALLSMKPQTPVNIPLLSDLLKTHPNQNFIANLTAGLTQDFRVGYRGNCFPKTAKNLPSAYQHPLLIEGNLLEEVELGRLAGPFKSPPFQIFRSIPLGWSLKRIAKNGVLFSTSLYPKGPPIALTPTSHLNISPSNIFTLTTLSHWSLNTALAVS